LPGLLKKRIQERQLLGRLLPKAGQVKHCFVRSPFLLPLLLVLG
jgi:hypothetical protein